MSRGVTVTPSRLGVAVAVAALLISPAPALALLGDSQGPAGLDGSFRTTLGLVDNTLWGKNDVGDDVDVISQSALRLVLSGRPDSWVRYEVHGLQTVTYSSAPADFGFGLENGGRGVRYRALDLRLRWDEHEHLVAGTSLDRANATFRAGPVDLTVGRQAITFGKAYFWSILDVFLPFDPEQFDRDYKPGVDAIRLDLALGSFSGINIVAAAGPDVPSAVVASGNDGFWDSSWFGSAVLGRVFTNVGGWDLALQGGKVFGGYQVGFGAVGEIGPLELRLEAIEHFADDSPPLIPPGSVPTVEGDLVEDSTSIVIGTGRRFENSLTIEFEYFHNGAGSDDDLIASALRSSSGGLLSWSENLAGLAISYELSPIVVGSFGTIVSLDDGSVQLQPRVTWSAADEVEVLAGAILNAGSGTFGGFESEFGILPNLFYTEVKYYF